MADFTKAFNETMKFEGGYVNDPDDRGGETYKGIAYKHNPNWDGWELILLHRRKDGFPASLEADEALQAIVRVFYEEHYWDELGCGEIADQSVAEAIFDYGVNAGVSAASKAVQRVVRVSIDGDIGPVTLMEISLFQNRSFLFELGMERMRHYIGACNKTPSNKKYLFGWIQRALYFFPSSRRGSR